MSTRSTVEWQEALRFVRRKLRGGKARQALIVTLRQFQNRDGGFPCTLEALNEHGFDNALSDAEAIFGKKRIVIVSQGDILFIVHLNAGEELPSTAV